MPRSGGALGFTYIPPTNEDRYLLFVDELRGRLVTLLGGRAAEEVVYSGRVSTGALDDIRRATYMAYKAVAEYGLNDTVGPISLATLSNGGMDESGGAAPWGRDQVPILVLSWSFLLSSVQFASCIDDSVCDLKGHLVELVQREVKSLLQSALEVALSVVRANPTVLEGLGAQLEGTLGFCPSLSSLDLIFLHWLCNVFGTITGCIFFFPHLLSFVHSFRKGKSGRRGITRMVEASCCSSRTNLLC